jgi:3-hydroxybenzoate 6-monooxygenase
MADDPILIAGGGLGGLAVALALGKQARRVRVLEATAELGAIGYGIQLGPNVFPMFERLGIADAVLAQSILPRACTMFDAFTGEEITRIPGEAALRARFGHPYIVIHRVDLHGVLLAASKALPNVTLEPLTSVTRFEQNGKKVTVIIDDGRRIEASALIGADGLRSAVRAQIVNDGEPRPIGYVAHRTLLPITAVPDGVQRDISAIWIGPGFHLVHYPVRENELFNIVAVFRTGSYGEKGDLDFHTAEVERTYRTAHPVIKSLLALMDFNRRWTIADRDPVRHWSQGRATILGDAAHPALQTFAQGACMAIEDAVALGACVEQAGDDYAAAFRAYEKARLVRTARIQLEGRSMWDGYHAEGIARDVWLSTFRRDERAICECLSWLYEGIELPGQRAAKEAAQ